MDYKLKNRDGVETTYTKEKLKIPAATGDSMVVFTQGEAQAEKTVDVDANGAFTVEPDAGYSFVKKVSGTVAVPTPEPVLQEKSVNITSNGQTSVTPDSGKDGLSKVDITVNVPASTPVLQEKAVTITANGTTEVTPDSGQDGLSKVAITTSVPSIIRGSLSEVVPVAYEMLKKAQTLPGNPYGIALRHGVPVLFIVMISSVRYEFWGSLRYQDNKSTSNVLVWQSRVLSKRETGFAVDASFGARFKVAAGVVDTDDYFFTDISTAEDPLPATLYPGVCATITDWLS